MARLHILGLKLRQADAVCRRMVELASIPSSVETAPQRGERLLFVGGSPRSGTTLVQNVLDSHPTIYGGPEFDHVPNVIQLRSRLLDGLRSGRIASYVDAEAIDRAMADLLETLLLPSADRAGARLLSEKSPHNVKVFSPLLEMLPGTRAVYASLTRVAMRYIERGGPLPPTLASIRARLGEIMVHLQAGFEAAARFPERVLVLRYETLVQDPRPAVERLCAFAGVRFSPHMLHPEANAHDGRRSVDDIWYTDAEYQRPIVTDRLHAWRDVVPPDVQEIIHRAFSTIEPLLALGYDLTPVDAPPGQDSAGPG